MCSVGIQECTGNIDDLFSSPGEYQTRVLGYDCNFGCLQVLFCGIFQELLTVFRVDDNGHTLLGLGDGDLGSVEAGIFFRYFVQIDLKSRCQLADGNGNSACTEVVAFFNQKADFLAAEQSLQFTLSRCVSFLYLCTAGLDGFCRMYFGGTGCTAAAISSSTAAEQDDDIARIGIFTDNGTARCCSKDSSDLHTFCHVVRMVNFFDIAGCKTDLVSVGAVAVCCFSYKFFLRKFSFECFALRTGRICGSGHTHCLIYVGSAGKRVTDCTAKAGCCTTERLDLGRVVVGLVFEVDQPLFVFSVYIYRYDDGACVDFIRLFLICEFSFGFQFFHCQKGKVHKADEFVVTAFVEYLTVA